MSILPPLRGKVSAEPTDGGYLRRHFLSNLQPGRPSSAYPHPTRFAGHLPRKGEGR